MYPYSGSTEVDQGEFNIGMRVYRSLKSGEFTQSPVYNLL